MKKIIGVAILLLTLALTVIYRQLTHRPSVERPSVRVETERTLAFASSILITI